MADKNLDRTVELSANFSVEVAGVEDERPPHVLIALHGIRDDSSWSYELLDRLSPFNDKIIVAPVSYGRLSSFRFLLNIGSRSIDDKVVLRFDAIRKIHPSSPISILSHSNGTKILSRILPRINFQPEYIFLVGSVCHLDDCDRLKASRRVVNECGLEDVFPVIAETIRPSLFGATGVFGFNNYPIKDRHFNYKHSDGLDRQHFNNYIVPIIINGRVANIDAKRSKLPTYLSYYIRRSVVGVVSLLALVILYKFVTRYLM